MKIEIFTLCDFAGVDASGKLNIIGSFDVVWSKEAPVVHMGCYMAVKVRFEASESRRKKVRFSFIGEDGETIIPSLEGILEIPPSSETPSVSLVLNIPRLSLSQFGECSIDMIVDGHSAACLPLYVKRMPDIQELA